VTQKFLNICSGGLNPQFLGFWTLNSPTSAYATASENGCTDRDAVWGSNSCRS